ncbi:small, acid-soluble spore protein, alpha/beta type [Faecalicatena contorta]|uniref:small, acid-soluble spore protein, alpha/beta type n=1 Tax=Faecalicatena contorta TaxID=39482 RepID=UPI001F471621|nr:small, acid-soluble spore protein, alpha/beta type [Faecalicatena contorta]MCF2555497.1 small, acid-soluble spore protein, alpha/beta type [Faecalicatena contorta]
MSEKKKKPIRLEEMTQEEKMKYEIAGELGLLDQVMTEGWRSLSSKETGRIGGILARRKKELKKNNESITNR